MARGYWSPDEPGVVRFPKPEGKESFEIADDFNLDELEMLEVVDGVAQVTATKRAEVESKRAERQARKDAFRAREQAKEEKMQRMLEAFERDNPGGGRP